MPNVNRRKLLKSIGAASLVGIGSTVSAAASESSSDVARLQGDYDSPLSFDETKERVEKLVSQNPNVSDSVLDNWAIPEYGDDYKIVEYVARIDSRGKLSQYYGATAEDQESEAHDKGAQKAESFEEEEEEEEVTTQAIDVGPDWNFVQDDQANVTDHFGELNNNYEWYRIRDSGQERNAFRSSVASSDDTINPYGREINVEHDWSVSELGNEEIHEAGPSSTGSGSTSVGIGFPPSATLSWTFDSDGPITQNLTNDGPVVSWNNEIPSSGTSWFYPGSHVISDPATCGNDQDVISMEANTTWGLVYELTHTWNIHTETC